MKKVRLFIIVSILGFINVIYSQNINIQQDNKISELVESHKKANLKVNCISGYRVQIFFDSGANSKQNASKVKNNFNTKYPEVPVYLFFKEPNFRVRAGDFRTRHEARGFLIKILSEYPNAFVVKDEINYPPLDNKKIEEN